MEFPKLSNNQIAVIIADGETGAILKVNGELFKNDSLESAYLIFDSLTLAKEFIQIQSSLNDRIEFVIYDKEQNVVEYIKASYWE